MADGERIPMGEVVFQILHSPCNTLEPISVPVTDRSRGEETVLLRSGGALLVGGCCQAGFIRRAETTARHGEVIGKMFQEKILTILIL